jgi:Na+-driven multidrug efflux pump
LHGAGFRRLLFRDILRVGAVAALITVQTNLTIAIATGIVGSFGTGAIAGYGIGSRLEYLLVPLVFGLGSPLVAMVGTNIGANRRERALRTAWIGGAMAAGLCEMIGLCAAAFPRAWLSLFDTDPAMLDAGSRYLHTVGPLYGFFGLGMALYFASQGAGRLLWPLLANGDLSVVFAALGAALTAFGLLMPQPSPAAPGSAGSRRHGSASSWCWAARNHPKVAVRPLSYRFQKKKR